MSTVSADQYVSVNNANQGVRIMYHITVRVTMEDGTEMKQWFDDWTDAAQWITRLANEGDDLPSVVTMTMESG